MCLRTRNKSCISRHWIRIVDDWNDLVSYGVVKCTELGCWLADGEAYPKHFGLYYTGQSPSLSQIMEKMDILINHEKESIDEIKAKIKELGFK